MTKNEVMEIIEAQEMELSIRAQREFEKLEDAPEAVKRFCRKHNISEPNPDMIAWQKVRHAREMISEILREEDNPVALMLASAGIDLPEDDADSVENARRIERYDRIIKENEEAAKRWERWTGTGGGVR